jgi:hypothetical protein
VSLKREVDDEGSRLLEKRPRVDVLNHQVPTLLPPPPSIDVHSSPNMGLLHASIADTRMKTNLTEGELCTVSPVSCTKNA